MIDFREDGWSNGVSLQASWLARRSEERGNDLIQAPSRAAFQKLGGFSMG